VIYYPFHRDNNVASRLAPSDDDDDDFLCSLAFDAGSTSLSQM